MAEAERNEAEKRKAAWQSANWRGKLEIATTTWQFFVALLIGTVLLFWLRVS